MFGPNTGNAGLFLGLNVLGFVNDLSLTSSPVVSERAELRVDSLASDWNGSLPPSMGASGEWYALHTRSNFEQRVAAELSAKGIENFLPAYQEVHQWTQRKKLVNLPLFPGYVFASFENSSSMRLAVLRTAGVVRILSSGAKLEPVPYEELEALRRIVQSRQRYDAHPFLRTGVCVRITRGVLKGLEGTLSHLKNKTRVVTSITLLCRSIAVEVDAQDLEVI